jgi:hypothetical protein
MMLMMKTVVVPAPTSRETIRVNRDVRYVAPPYRALGNGAVNGAGESIDLFSIGLKLPAAERKLLGELVEAYDRETGLSMVQTWEDAASFSKALKVLREKLLVKRVKKGVFMLNPRAIINPPKFQEFEGVWSKLD